MVTAYVSDGFNRAERLTGNKKTSVGFAMTILQRRLASSPKAIYKSLERRTERLQKILRDKKLENVDDNFDAEEMDEEFPSGELETTEEDLATRATSAKNLRELQAEIKTLQRLTAVAKKLFQSGNDKKWNELSELLQRNVFQGNREIGNQGNSTNSQLPYYPNSLLSRRDKLIIFTEHRDTLDYLQEKISSLFGREDVIATIHGGLNHRERRRIQENFKANENILVLIATDAAGEGINLQNAHLMINYDLPWNPNRLEQRFGRIHRIGQKNICHLWNLVANQTREGQVFHRLLKKLEKESSALGGKVFDILGKISFDNKPLSELLIEAIRYGNDPATIRRLDNVVDKSFDADKLRELLRERALTQDFMNLDKVADISQNMERGEARKLQPYFIKDFFLAAFKKLGGQIYLRGNGRYEIPHVPKNIRDFNATIKQSYKRICFAKDNADAEFLTFGHPLLSATTSLLLKNFGDVLRQGAILIDDGDSAKNFRLLFYVETTITDGREQILSKRLHFVELSQTSQKLSTSPAPYLDYRSPNDFEREKILPALENVSWLNGNVEERAINFAAENILKPLQSKIAAQKKIFLDKLEREIKTRLGSEISYWDTRADKLNELATRRADELENRLKRRLAEIKLERKIFAAAPVIAGCALIVPRGYLELHTADARDRVEIIAMNAVMQIERELGNTPADVSKNNCGYDIESSAPNGFLRFIEVKGRNADADTVTVTKNEINTALNSPENFILAIVMVSGNAGRVVYLQMPFTSPPDFNAVSVNYKISSLIRQGNVLIDRNISCGGV